MAAHGIPFACIPTGTRNQFARDVGVNRRDVTGALDASAGGVERLIDIAEVNGRTFLNNVSLGIYGDALRRPAYRETRVHTLVRTMAEVMGPSAEGPALCLVDDLRREHRHPVIVLVSNNLYALHRPLVRGTRPTLASGQLAVLVLDAAEGSPRARGRAWTVPCLGVSASASVHAGVDGEAVDLSPPLRFAIRSAALPVEVFYSPGHPITLRAEPQKSAGASWPCYFGSSGCRVKSSRQSSSPMWMPHFLAAAWIRCQASSRSSSVTPST